MGNEISSSDVEGESTDDTKSQVDVDVQNGPVTLQSSPVINTAPHNTQENSKATAQQENIITSSQKTIILSPIANGTDAKPPAPPAKSKFRLTISHPSPGRTAFQPNGPENGDVQSEGGVEQPALIQTQNNAPITVETNVTKESMGGGRNQVLPTVLPTDDVSLSQTNTIEVESTPSKPKEVSIFHRLFKPEKKVQFEEPVQTEDQENQEVVITVNQNDGLQSAPPSANLQIQNVDKGNQAAVDGQSSEPAGVPVGPETSTEATQTSPEPEIHPVMSFFKTLVNKPGSKSEEESRPDVEDKKKKENGGMRKSSSKKEKGKAATLQASEAEMRAQKKAESSKSSTLGRLFRPKSKKDEVEAGGGKITAAADDGKGAKETPTRPRLFWRKSSTEQESLPAKADSRSKSSPVTEGKSQQGKKADEGKNSKPKIMMFFRQLTLDITDGVEVGKSEKTVVTAVVEPPPAPPLQKAKENPKEKKASSEKLAKQESRESPEAAASSQVQVAEAAPVQNGAESSKEGQMKRVEKRQSLGSFFKAIGPKRLCDAEVQTDPVSILPAEKAK